MVKKLKLLELEKDETELPDFSRADTVREPLASTALKPAVRSADTCDCVIELMEEVAMELSMT
ncbi:hypothetical protein TSH100_05220 [Azospirillum sp. TSH100]|nr:hypothetical protein TSH100_05220 [Azospirillum sp. TSH100]